MNRRGLFALSVSAVLCGLPAMASVTDEILRDLRTMGFVEMSVSRTLLGRERIVATGPQGWREIIVNPRTGEILRDVFIRFGGGSGRLLDGDDDRDDDRDDRSDSDNSDSDSSSDNSGGDDDD